MEINATLVVQCILFLSLLVWLSRFLFKPFLELFDARERSIAGAKKEALELQDELQKKLFAVEDKIKESQKEARQALLDLKAEGMHYQRQVLDTARMAAKEKADLARNQLINSVSIAKKELEQEVSNLSEMAISQILQINKDSGFSGSNFGKMESRSA